MKLEDLGERRIVKKIAAFFGVEMDDSAVISVHGKDLLLTSDVVSAARHKAVVATMEDFGWYACAVSLSDIAAMGGTPLCLIVDFLCPSSMRISDLLKISAGIRDCAEAFGTKIIGGDTKESVETHVAITVLGIAQHRVLRRCGARVGDKLLITGELGGAYAAHYALTHGIKLPKKAYERLIRPVPRVGAGLLLAKNGATACIDVSDGLYISLHYLCSASQVGARIDRASLPVSSVLKKLNKKCAVDDALKFGGDFELVAAAPPERAEFIVAELRKSGLPAAIIGEVVAKNKGIKVRIGNKLVKMPVAGYEHFSSRSYIG